MTDKKLNGVLKTLTCFCTPETKNSHKVYDNKIFVHNDIMYSTDGRIMAVADNLTDKKEFSYFTVDKKDFKYFESDAQQVKETKTGTKDGFSFERIINNFNYFELSFDIDFTDIPKPYKLMSLSPTKRYYNNRAVIDCANGELIFNFNGGLGNGNEGDGCKVTYGDVIKNIKIDNEKTSCVLNIQAWFILEMMRKCKTDILHFDCYPERYHAKVTAGEYTFYLMLIG